jgi:hypothetical protein
VNDRRHSKSGLDLNQAHASVAVQKSASFLRRVQQAEF